MKIINILSLLQAATTIKAFVAPTGHSHHHSITPTYTTTNTHTHTKLSMARTIDPVTYLRTEWVAAALCTNQTPRSADVVLQLGSEDGRVVQFVPRTVREIITSSAEKEGGLTVSCERQLKQMAERRGSGATITYSNQPSDDLRDTPSSSVDVVISMQTAQRMRDNGQNWKRGIDEATRVLKPGGRFLFVESTMIEGSGDGDDESYLDYLVGLSNDDGEEDEVESQDDGDDNVGEEEDVENNDELESNSSPSSVFVEVGFDKVDLVLQPHIAGVAVKAMDADLTQAQKEELTAQEESDRLAELSLSAFERGSKRRKRKKTKNQYTPDGSRSGGGGAAGMAGLDGTMES